MALHPVKLPKAARLLFKVVLLQRQLLEALADPHLMASSVSVDWLQTVWESQDPLWVKKFCRGQKGSILNPIGMIASSPYPIRKALYDEFCVQNCMKCHFDAGGCFRSLTVIPGISGGLIDAVKTLTRIFYDRLGHDNNLSWNGYEFSHGKQITKKSYKEVFRLASPPLSVCPYCDGGLRSPELDHYFPQCEFPMLACNPQNLIPVCTDCNRLSGKGKLRPISVEPNPSTREYLHPLFRPASRQAHIRLSGKPSEFIPQLYSDDPLELARLNNHARVIPSLGSRWTWDASTFFDKLVRDVKRKTLQSGTTVEDFVKEQIDDLLENRGREPFTMIRTAVCQAILDKRPGYIEELSTSNPPVLS